MNGEDYVYTTTIIIHDAPYGRARLWNTLRLAATSTSAAAKIKVNTFLGDAR
jgi:sulfur relay (sulfurtransferase) complex TusBCD TusD component (DsrE family)